MYLTGAFLRLVEESPTETEAKIIRKPAIVVTCERQAVGDIGFHLELIAGSNVARVTPSDVAILRDTGVFIGRWLYRYGCNGPRPATATTKRARGVVAAHRAIAPGICPKMAIDGSVGGSGMIVVRSAFQTSGSGIRVGAGRRRLRKR